MQLLVRLKGCMLDRNRAGIMTPRRILFISHSSSLDGSNRSLFDTIRFLDQSRLTCRVVFPRPGLAPELFTRQGIPLDWSRPPLLHFFDAQGCSRIQPHLFFREAMRFLNHAQKLRKIYRHWRPELVVLNSSCLIATAFLLKRWGIPFVWHDREVMAQRGIWRRISRSLCQWMIRSAKMVVTPSHFSAEVFNGSTNVRTIWGGVDADFFTPSGNQAAAKRSLGLAPETPTVGFVGQLTEEKGFVDFVKAIFIVIRSAPRLRMIVVGEGAAKISRLLRSLKLDKVVLLTGFWKDVRIPLNAMDVVVFPPSKPESFGLALAEAMAMEKAVIEADSGPAREIVEDGKSGILVPPGDPLHLAEAIVKLLQDPAKRAYLGMEARKRIRERFDIRMLVPEIQAVYEEALNGFSGNSFRT